MGALPRNALPEIDAMLKLLGRQKAQSVWTGISRRRFIEIGAISTLGWTLADQLRAEQSSGHQSKRSVILIWQHGGPSQTRYL